MRWAIAPFVFQASGWDARGVKVKVVAVPHPSPLPEGEGICISFPHRRRGISGFSKHRRVFGEACDCW